LLCQIYIIYNKSLWGDQGQNSLETANICLLNATVSGTESLKNLILPGIILISLLLIINNF